MSNEYLVVYIEGSHQDRTTFLRGQLVNRDGSRQGESFPISFRPPGRVPFSVNTSVVHNGLTDQYLVVWDRATAYAASTRHIVVQILNGSGGLEGENFTISSSDLAQYPAITYNGQGNQYLAVWENTENLEVNASQILGQKIDMDGSLINDNFLICCGN